MFRHRPQLDLMMNEKQNMQIRPLRQDDLAIRVKWMNDPRVNSSMHFDIPVMLDKTIKWYANNLNNEKRSDVVFIERGQIVAFGGLTSITDKPRKAELYIFVNPEGQRNGVGSAAVNLLCGWGFQNLNLWKIYLLTNEDNFAAVRIYEKCGFHLEGRHRQEYVTDKGEYKDRLYFGLLKTDYGKCFV